MFDELSEDEIEASSSELPLPGDTAATDTVNGEDWREQKIGVGPVEVRR